MLLLLLLLVKESDMNKIALHVGRSSEGIYWFLLILTFKCEQIVSMIYEALTTIYKPKNP